MKVVVTGGAGFIGAYLTRRLVKSGFEVCVIDNFSRGVPSRLSSIDDKITLINLDLRTDFSEFEKITEGTDILFHLAAVNGTENFYNHPDLVLDVGIYGMLNVLNSVEKNNIQKLIVASSAEVYQSAKVIPTPEDIELVVPNPKEPRYSYATSKLVSEVLTLNYIHSGRINNACIFRPHNVYGPDMGFKHVIPQFLERAIKISDKNFNEDFTIYGNGKETRAFCFVEDIVDGLMILLENSDNGEIYHIGSEDEISINELFDSINHLFDNKLKAIHADGFSGATSRRCPSILKMKNLGYSPKYNLNSGIGLTYEFYKNVNFEDNMNSLA